MPSQMPDSHASCASITIDAVDAHQISICAVFNLRRRLRMTLTRRELMKCNAGLDMPEPGARGSEAQRLAPRPTYAGSTRSQIVTGPSLVRLTFICAPNLPLSTSG